MQNINLCIAYPNKLNYRETFIWTQIYQIKPKYSIYGGWYPIYDQNDKIFLRFPITNYFVRGVLKNMFPKLFQKIYTKQFVSFIKRNKIEVVFANYGLTGCSLVAACDKTKIPLIVHFHGFDAAQYKILKKYKKLYQKLFEVSYKIIVVSEVMKNMLVDFGANKEKIINNPYGIDLNKFKDAKPESTQAIFIAVGRFTEKKSPQNTIMAFDLVKRIFKDAKLVMIGEGKLLDECIELVAKLGIIEAVEFKGGMNSDQIIEEFRKSRVFVQHSVRAKSGDMEGTPVSILEASAMGLPIVSTFHAGIKEAVIDGETGFLVEEGDYEKMSEYMLTLADNAEKAGEMGRAARNHITKDYSLDFRIKKLKEIIFSAVKK